MGSGIIYYITCLKQNTSIKMYKLPVVTNRPHFTSLAIILIWVSGIFYFIYSLPPENMCRFLDCDILFVNRTCYYAPRPNITHFFLYKVLALQYHMPRTNQKFMYTMWRRLIFHFAFVKNSYKFELYLIVLTYIYMHLYFLDY